jgi:hypothetical protein
MIRRTLLKVVGIVLAWLFLAAVSFLMVSLALWLLIPAAFPMLAFGFPNAMALAVVVFMVGVPAIKN